MVKDAFPCGTINTSVSRFDPILACSASISQMQQPFRTVDGASIGGDSKRHQIIHTIGLSIVVVSGTVVQDILLVCQN